MQFIPGHVSPLNFYIQRKLSTRAVKATGLRDRICLRMPENPGAPSSATLSFYASRPNVKVTASTSGKERKLCDGPSFKLPSPFFFTTRTLAYEVFLFGRSDLSLKRRIGFYGSSSRGNAFYERGVCCKVA